jgi:undecaprenyl-diphosphatase
MNIPVAQLPNENLLVRPIHTAVKGRARYKVKGLHREKSLKKYLEFRLSEEDGIAQVRANHLTGSVLVIFHPDISTNAIALFIQDIILDYRKEAGNLINELNTSPLSSLSAKEKLEQDGLNTLPQTTYRSKLSILLKQFKSFPAAFLTAAAGLALATRGLADAVVLMGVVATNTVIGYATESQSKKILKETSVNQPSAFAQRVLISGVIGTLVLGTLVLHKYNLDTKILLAIQKLHAPISDRIMLGITYLGEPAALLSICLGLGIGPLFYNRRLQATTLAMAAISAFSLNYWLKMLFGRARPQLWNRLLDVSLHSFPSGHAMMSMVIYGFLGYVLAKQFPQWRGRIFTFTAILITAIGFSRLYLGVHWPTDVVAGYAVGLMWLIVCILILELQQQYRQLPKAS